MRSMNVTWTPKRGKEPICEGCGIILVDSRDWYEVTEPSGPKYYLCVDCMVTFTPQYEPGTSFELQ